MGKWYMTKTYHTNMYDEIIVFKTTAPVCQILMKKNMNDLFKKQKIIKIKSKSNNKFPIRFVQYNIENEHKIISSS